MCGLERGRLSGGGEGKPFSDGEQRDALYKGEGASMG